MASFGPLQERFTTRYGSVVLKFELNRANHSLNMSELRGF